MGEGVLVGEVVGVTALVPEGVTDTVAVGLADAHTPLPATLVEPPGHIVHPAEPLVE